MSEFPEGGRLDASKTKGLNNWFNWLLSKIRAVMRHRDSTTSKTTTVVEGWKELALWILRCSQWSSCSVSILLPYNKRLIQGRQRVVFLVSIACSKRAATDFRLTTQIATSEGLAKVKFRLLNSEDRYNVVWLRRFTNEKLLEIEQKRKNRFHSGTFRFFKKKKKNGFHFLLPEFCWILQGRSIFWQ